MAYKNQLYTVKIESIAGGVLFVTMRLLLIIQISIFLMFQQCSLANVLRHNTRQSRNETAWRCIGTMFHCFPVLDERPTQLPLTSETQVVTTQARGCNVTESDGSRYDRCLQLAKRMF
ncbi:hypothetical protein AB6A40_009694 [Gnathostoma spinigerum]|uniref:Uncharacterized protein n=1 Tax=Gnathostoma spinigerum TaxID=75299 RepID=A0ABD6ESP3_9BILA